MYGHRRGAGQIHRALGSRPDYLQILTIYKSAKERKKERKSETRKNATSVVRGATVGIAAAAQNK
jgi:hypothetical protein